MRLKSFAITIIGICFFTTLALAQQTVTVTCNLQFCQGEPSLYRFNGADLEVFLKPLALSDSTFQFNLPKTAEPAFYYIGERKESSVPFLLGTEKSVQIKGSCQAIRQATVIGSPLNDQYNAVKAQIAEFKRQTTALGRKFQSAEGNMAEMNKVTAELKSLDSEKVKYLDSLRQKQPLFAKIVALETYLSYQNNGDKYPNEIDYFANEFFRFADFKDKGYENLPWVYESFKNYTATLSAVNLEDGMLKAYLEKNLQKIPKGSRTQLLAMNGVITALKQRQHADYAYFAEQFIQEFKDELPQYTFDLKTQLDYNKSFAIGGTAPDFTQKTPDDKDFKLSDLRGKVVLVDFWASWCGPCRRENPNVVKMYNEYKGKGFEILGVSLDNSKDRWLQAIQQDGLTWQHVSDLKGWQNAVAQQYSIRAIPHTILLDAEGKIIARNLRGPALEQKLAEIFSKP